MNSGSNDNRCLFARLFVQTLRFASKPMTDCLLMLRNERWKRVRSILTPSFSAAKMKEVRNERVDNSHGPMFVTITRGDIFSLMSYSPS